MAKIRHLENRQDVYFYAEGGPIWIKFRRLVNTNDNHVDCGDMVEIETRSRILTWRTFWGIQWHIPEPGATSFSAYFIFFLFS